MIREKSNSRKDGGTFYPWMIDGHMSSLSQGHKAPKERLYWKSVEAPCIKVFSDQYDSHDSGAFGKGTTLILSATLPHVDISGLMDVVKAFGDQRMKPEFTRFRSHYLRCRGRGCKHGRSRLDVIFLTAYA